MKLHKLAAIGLAALLLTAGAAMAMPGDAPDHSNSDASDAADERDENATAAEDDDVDETEMSENETADDGDADADDADANAEDRDANAADAGPPTDMPEQVPDHVSQIHDLIRQFLNGDGDGSLGDQISDVTANENATDAGADEQADQNATDA